MSRACHSKTTNGHGSGWGILMASDANTVFDAIVVGSGMSGGWAAKELTERGLKVLLLERGHNVTHRTDYLNDSKAPWEMRYAGQIPEEVVAREYAVAERLLRIFGLHEALFRQRSRESVRDGARQTVRVDTRLPPWWPVINLASAKLSLVRPGFRGE